MDAFTQNLASENDGLVPLTTLVGKVLSHMSDCKAFGSLIVTMWTSAYFRSLLCSYGAHLNLNFHTLWWGIFDLQSLEVLALFDNFIISLFFSYGDTMM